MEIKENKAFDEQSVDVQNEINSRLKNKDYATVTTDSEGRPIKKQMLFQEFLVTEKRTYMDKKTYRLKSRVVNLKKQ